MYAAERVDGDVIVVLKNFLLLVGLQVADVLGLWRKR